MNKASQGAFKLDIYPGTILDRDPGIYLKLPNDGVQDMPCLMS